MLFNIQLSAFYPDKQYGGDRIINDMVEQAVLADQLGFDGASITEHHLINILMMPAPLQFAVHLANKTKNLKIMTSVLVLPIHDMRTYAGELATTDIFTEGRVMFGVGRGAFGFEMNRLGVPLSGSREKFDDSLNLLMKLLTEEEVAWDSNYYKFDPITIMPRPVYQPEKRIMMGVLVPEAIYHCTKRGFHIQTTPLSGDKAHMLEQVDAFNRGKAELGNQGEHLTLTLSRVAYLANDIKDQEQKIKQAHHYYGMFDNVFTGDGIVHGGMIEPTPRKMTLDQTRENLTICPTSEMIDKLSVYAEAGVDRFIMNMNFGASQSELLDTIQRFAEEVKPHFDQYRIQPKTVKAGN
jgi:alkanesulfonate monooxygenase SsuD/methylene tetrahydromethanopterin reductase-like flavin-dependent oxidoreductase (luciferase family)